MGLKYTIAFSEVALADVETTSFAVDELAQVLCIFFK